MEHPAIALHLMLEHLDHLPRTLVAHVRMEAGTRA